MYVLYSLSQNKHGACVLTYVHHMCMYVYDYIMYDCIYTYVSKVMIDN